MCSEPAVAIVIEVYRTGSKPGKNRNMGLSEDGDDATANRYEELCLDLNMDPSSKQEAWLAFQRIRVNYTLEVGLNVHPAMFVLN